MLIYLGQYSYGARVVSFASSEDAKSSLSRSHLSYCYNDGSKLHFVPEGFSIDLGESALQKISQCNDFDIWMIYENGVMNRVYDNGSNENAFMLTGRCNSNCIMCPAPDYQRKKDGMSLKDNLEIVRRIPDTTEHITITGGEPFLFGPAIFEILSEMKERFPNTQFQLLTNGRALSYRSFLEHFVSSCPANMIVGIPLHGYDNETHDFITRSPGGFRQTKEGIRNLLRNRLSVELRLVVSKLNCKYITKIAELIVNQFPGTSRVEIMGLEMMGNALKNKDNVWLSYPDAFNASRDAIDLLSKNGISVGLYNFPLCSMPAKYHFIAKRSITGYKVCFPSGCDRCTLQDACGGFFNSSLKFAEQDIKPVKK